MTAAAGSPSYHETIDNQNESHLTISRSQRVDGLVQGLMSRFVSCYGALLHLIAASLPLAQLPFLRCPPIGSCRSFPCVAPNMDQDYL